MGGSRRFTVGSGNHAALDSLPTEIASIPFHPFTFSGWIKPRTTTPSISHTMFCISHRGVVAHYYTAGLQTVATVPSGGVMSIADGSITTKAFDPTRQWTTTEWMHVGFRTNANSNLRGWLDGVLASQSTSRTPDNQDTLGIGGLLSSSAQEFAHADIAWCALWSQSLSNVEMTALATGVSPFKIRPSLLVSVWPFWETVATDDVKDIAGPYNLETYSTTGSTPLETPGASLEPQDDGPPVELWYPGKGLGFFDMGRNRSVLVT